MNACCDIDRAEAADCAARWQDRRTFAYPALLLLALVLTFRVYLGPVPLRGDLTLYWVWADQFTSQLAHGNLYPRWMPASNAGLGAPVFYFYPPISFYLTGAFGLVGFSTYGSLIAVFGTAFAASGVACWHWLKARSNHPLLGAAFFMAAPYHLFDYAGRYALAESVGVALIPVLAIGLRRIAERHGGVAMTAVAYALLIATHLPLALLASVLLIGPYALVHRRRLKEFALAVAAGAGMAAIYLVPALGLQRFRDVGQLYRTASLNTAYWSIFTRNWGDVTYTAVFLIMGSIIAASLLPALRRDRRAICAIGITLIAAGIIPSFWSLPLLGDVQFPFRALTIAEFALATALARLPRKPSLAIAPVAFPLLVSVMLLPGFHYAGGDELRRLQAAHPDAYEYVPRGVIKVGTTNAKLSEVLAERIPPPRVPGMIVEPHFYFPSWSCGAEEPRTQLLVHAPSCSPHLVWTWAEKLGAAISLLSVLVLAAWSATAPLLRMPAGRISLASPLLHRYAGVSIPEGDPAFEQRASNKARRPG